MTTVPTLTRFKSQHRHHQFLPLLSVTFIIWLLYRILFVFPVWFDESIGKFIFFGLPVWLYVIVAQTRVIFNSMSAKKLIPGLYLGLAFGGLYGFIGTVAFVADHQQFSNALLFLTPEFWWEFLLALLTGFWESLFFFGWVLAIAEKRFPSWDMTKMLAFTALVFILFHIPNTILRFPVSLIIPQIILLGFFSVGQALLFIRYRNIYTLAISHAIWGMVLLIYGSY